MLTTVTTSGEAPSKAELQVQHVHNLHVYDGYCASHQPARDHGSSGALAHIYPIITAPTEPLG